MLKIDQFISLLYEAFENNKTFKMPVKGTSMLPFINETHYVVLNKPLNIKRNDIVFYKRDNGQYVLHRIFKIKKDGYVLLGDNQVALEKGVREDQLIGKVEYVVKKDKIVYLKGFKYNLYLLFWNNRLIRRFCFIFTRRRKNYE